MPPLTDKLLFLPRLILVYSAVTLGIIAMLLLGLLVVVIFILEWGWPSKSNASD